MLCQLELSEALLLGSVEFGLQAFLLKDIRR